MTRKAERREKPGLMRETGRKLFVGLKVGAVAVPRKNGSYWAEKAITKRRTVSRDATTSGKCAEARSKVCAFGDVAGMI